jgi:hypothetical protein
MVRATHPPTWIRPHGQRSRLRRRCLCLAAAIATLALSTSCGGNGQNPCEGLEFCSAAHYPEGNWRPYDVPGNPFYTPLSDAGDPAHLRQHSTPALSAPVQDRPGNLITDEAGVGGGEPTYYDAPANALSGRFTLNCINDEFGRADHSCPIDSARLNGLQVDVIAGAKPEGGRAIVVGQPRLYDSHMIIVDQRHGWEYDLWQVQSTSSFDQVEADGTVTKGLSDKGGHIDFSYGGRTQWKGTDGTAPHRPADPSGVLLPVDDSNAAHWAEMLGRVRAEEVLREESLPDDGEINHALFIVLPCTSPTVSVFPADPVGRGWPCGKEGVQAAVGTHPLGTRLWLDMSDSQIDQLPVPNWKKIFLRAMSRYGMFVGDTGGRGRLFDIETESGVMYTSCCTSDRWARFATESKWEPFTPPSGPNELVGKLYTAGTDTYPWASDVWTKLRVLEPCITPQQGTPC